MSTTVPEPTGLPGGPATAVSVRTRVRVPVRLGHGLETVADVFTFRGLSDGREHLALGLGPFADSAVPLVRPHSECLTGDVFGSLRCDCGPQLQEAVERITAVGGYLLYLRQEGRGIGLYNKLDAYALQDGGLDTFAANRALDFDDDERDYRPAAEMLGALGVDRVELLTSNPDKSAQLRALGVAVEAVHPTLVHAHPANLAYLRSKVDHTAHALDLGGPPVEHR